jgi:hypothetical protein
MVTLNGINILANWRLAKHQPRKPLASHKITTIFRSSVTAGFLA